jgi:hypothetical protein
MSYLPCTMCASGETHPVSRRERREKGMSRLMSTVGMCAGACAGLATMLGFAGSSAAGGILVAATGLAAWAGFGSAVLARVEPRVRKRPEPNPTPPARPADPPDQASSPPPHLRALPDLVPSAPPTSLAATPFPLAPARSAPSRPPVLTRAAVGSAPRSLGRPGVGDAGGRVREPAAPQLVAKPRRRAPAGTPHGGGRLVPCRTAPPMSRPARAASRPSRRPCRARQPP